MIASTFTASLDQKQTYSYNMLYVPMTCIDFIFYNHSAGCCNQASLLKAFFRTQLGKTTGHSKKGPHFLIQYRNQSLDAMWLYARNCVKSASLISLNYSSNRSKDRAVFHAL